MFLVDEWLPAIFSWVGKPEDLKHVLAGFWSRRITEEHRMVYRIEGDALLIAQLRLHAFPPTRLLGTTILNCLRRLAEILPLFCRQAPVCSGHPCHRSHACGTINFARCELQMLLQMRKGGTPSLAGRMRGWGLKDEILVQRDKFQRIVIGIAAEQSAAT
ncbi:MAG: Txe/YoeB family addiction module toxin [Gallionella sp.]|nr:Txe/YoeB family addiction module toxin [Gallionella sp.]